MPSVQLYTYAGENNRVNKTPYMVPQGLPYSGDIRGSIDMHNPDITINATISAEINYCSLTNGSETYYYFCRVENVRTGLSVLHCTRDVLMISGIMDVSVIPSRSASRYNAWLIDTRRPVETTVQHYNLQFSGAGFDYSNMSLIAGIVGTAGSPTNM